jgi:hypothetical protein
MLYKISNLNAILMLLICLAIPYNTSAEQLNRKTIYLNDSVPFIELWNQSYDRADVYINPSNITHNVFIAESHFRDSSILFF